MIKHIISVTACSPLWQNEDSQLYKKVYCTTGPLRDLAITVRKPYNDVLIDLEMRHTAPRGYKERPNGVEFDLRTWKFFEQQMWKVVESFIFLRKRSNVKISHTHVGGNFFIDFKMRDGERVAHLYRCDLDAVTDKLFVSERDQIMLTEEMLTFLHGHIIRMNLDAGGVDAISKASKTCEHPEEKSCYVCEFSK